MADFYPADDDRARIRWSIIDALRRHGTDSSRIGHAFAELHRLQPADLRALVAIMSAEGNGAPLTAGQLRDQLGLSSGGASLVIDRLEGAGHIRRARDHPTDNRVVHLRHTDQGRATGLAFFGSLGDRANSILDGFTDDELQIIARFITAMADSTRQHARELEERLPSTTVNSIGRPASSRARDFAEGSRQPRSATPGSPAAPQSEREDPETRPCPATSRARAANAVDWDPGTQSCERQDSGPVKVGSTWRNVSRFLSRQTVLDYRLTVLQPGHITLVGSNATATSTGDITVRDPLDRRAR